MVLKAVKMLQTLKPLKQIKFVMVWTTIIRLVISIEIYQSCMSKNTSETTFIGCFIRTKLTGL